MVPGAGVEPALPKKPDFESGASANSATQASISKNLKPKNTFIKTN